jgi:D-alanyl-D-alanine carboxypeptidase (penicillin-binding protein 5/6)
MKNALSRIGKWILSMLLAIALVVAAVPTVNVRAQSGTNGANASEELNLSCESAVLIEPMSGRVIYDKDKDKVLRPASVTKVMTLLLIMEAIDRGDCNLTDTVTVSEHAASMGGSQVFLEAGETQTVDDMIKCITVSSANDACVAMAEYLCGSEEAFVARMNERAKELGMSNTNFVNSCGLDVDGHVTTAYDIALMSRELTVKHPKIFDYTTIWMDTITHVTAKGTSEFGLSNTNKLIKQYSGATGLKTGSTSLAKFCLSATATRNDMSLIAVVMAAPDSKQRVKDASKLLDYGFANCSLYQDDKVLSEQTYCSVGQGKKERVEVVAKSDFNYVLLKGQDAAKITKKVTISKAVTAPVKKHQTLGKVVYYLDKQKLGEVELLAKQRVAAWNLKDCINTVTGRFLLKV